MANVLRKLAFSVLVRRKFAIIRVGNFLSITIDKKNNFVTVKIKHQSPHIAKEWTKLLIDQINSFYRKKDKKVKLP